MTIQYYSKNIFGHELFYPACQKAKLFTRLLNKKTFSLGDLIIIKELGIKVEEVLASSVTLKDGAA